MTPTRSATTEAACPNRRSFLQATAAAILAGGAGGPGIRLARAGDSPEGPSAPTPEWRNKQPDMAYRRLGRTNLMISEVVSGGDPITPDNYDHLNAALERGLNYLDMAPAYHQGKTEEAYGKLLEGSSARREKVFLTTKISGIDQLRERMYKEIFDGLSESKQEAILKRAVELRAERGVEKPGYFLAYFPGQQKNFESAYMRVAMLPEHGDKVEGSPKFKQFIAESLEGSLKRVGTDHFDIVMCPHGANTPEDLMGRQIVEAFQDLKAQGKVRFLGLTSHNDPAGVLGAAVDAGHYDLAMVAYNVVNGGYLEANIRRAKAADMGVIAMKVAMAVATHHMSLQPVPEWRIEKVKRVVPGDEKPPVKAYLWALQNPCLSGVISNLWDRTFIDENLAVAGRKVDLQPA